MDRKVVRYGMIVLFAIAIIFGACKGIAANKARKQNKENAVISFQDMNEKKLAADQLRKDNKIKNILLVGTDKRGSESGYGRSDCMMIATIDSKNQQLKLTSLPGQTYLDLPGYGKNQLSMAYSIGGISLLYETIANNYGVRLDNYAILDFPAFVKIMDKVGGVSVDLTDSEVRYMQEHYSNAAKQVSIGTNVLNGTQALAYVRIKQDAAGETGRMQRQRKVMQALFEQLSKMSVSDLVPVVSRLLKDTESDITVQNMKDYLASVIALGTSSLMMQTIPDSSQYNAKAVDGVMVYEIDTDSCKQTITDFIYNPVTKQKADDSAENLKEEE